MGLDAGRQAHKSEVSEIFRGGCGAAPHPPRQQQARQAHKTEISEIFGGGGGGGGGAAAPPPRQQQAARAGAAAPGAMHALMSFQPLDGGEAAHYSKSFFTGARAQGRRYIPPQAASAAPSKR
jgi:hypothetical protein